MKEISMQSKFPELKIIVDKDFEKHKVGAYFIDKAFRTNDFWAFDRFIKNYPELSKIKELKPEEAKEFLNKKIDEYYENEKNKLGEARLNAIKKWDKIKNKFFIESSRIFNHEWPLGDYKVVVSLFGMFRLVPGTKEFSIPSNDIGGDPKGEGQINATIIHEMLHILFEDFYKAKFGDLKLEKEKYYILLEVVNYIVLNLKTFKEITNWFFRPYPKDKEISEYLEKEYSKFDSMEEFVRFAVKYLNESEEKRDT